MRKQIRSQDKEIKMNRNQLIQLRDEVAKELVKDGWQHHNARFATLTNQRPGNIID